MRKIYLNIVFMQPDSADADEPLRILDEMGEHAALEYLTQWDYGDAYEENDESQAGRDDTIYREGDYLMSYNTRLGYIGLERIVNE